MLLHCYIIILFYSSLFLFVRPTAFVANKDILSKQRKLYRKNAQSIKNCVSQSHQSAKTIEMFTSSIYQHSSSSSLCSYTFYNNNRLLHSTQWSSYVV